MHKCQVTLSQKKQVPTKAILQRSFKSHVTKTYRSTPLIIAPLTYTQIWLPSMISGPLCEVSTGTHYPHMKAHKLIFLPLYTMTIEIQRASVLG